MKCYRTLQYIPHLFIANPVLHIAVIPMVALSLQDSMSDYMLHGITGRGHDIYM